MKKTVISSLCALALLAGSPLYADKVTDQIKAVEKAYAEKDYRMAVEEMEYLGIELQKLKSVEDQKLLPEALPGWKKEVGKSTAGMAAAMFGGKGGTTIAAKYKKANESVSIKIMANSPMLQVMSMMINNPAMAAQDKDTEPFRYKRNKGIKKVKNNKVEIQLLVAGQILLSITGKNLKDPTIVEKYLDSIDINAIKGALL